MVRGNNILEEFNSELGNSKILKTGKSMYIKNIQVENYKCFLDSGILEFSPGFNIIVGKNDSGKSTLVEALSLNFRNFPHLSIDTKPSQDSVINQGSKIQITISLDRNEFQTQFLGNDDFFYVPGVSIFHENVASQKIRAEFSNDFIDILYKYEDGNLVHATFKEFDNITSTNFKFQYLTGNNFPKLIDKNISVDFNQTKFYKSASKIRGNIFCFISNRFNIGDSNIGGDTNLNSNASNLALALHQLYTTKYHRFEKILRLFTQVFPQYQYITIPLVEGELRKARILLWEIDHTKERDDLAKPLQNSGTGISQVLAILYLVVTSDSGRPIIIDEPQSFLHPDALRKLFSVLKLEFSHHQYIITTHSPAVITAIDPEEIILLQKENFESKGIKINKDENDELRLILMEVGSRLSDVFGVDDIIWVEGVTEEETFPLIVEKILERPLLGTSILSVLNTGDFIGKNRKRVLEIYRRLSQGGGLIPPALGFIFDQEGYKEQLKDDLIRAGAGKVYFIKRRMFENYLLNPQAICAVVNNYKDYLEAEISINEIQSWISENEWDDKYFDSKVDRDIQSKEYWLEHINGAEFLKDIFKDNFSELLIYDKVVHGVELTKWLLENKKEDLNEISGLLNIILPSEE